MTNQYVDGPTDQPWEVEQDEAWCYVQRTGHDARTLDNQEAQQVEIVYAFYVDDDGILRSAHYLVTRLNALDRTRAALQRLADAVKAEQACNGHEVLATCACEMCDLVRAEQAAREVLDA